jgi:dihydropteroate synthase
MEPDGPTWSLRTRSLSLCRPLLMGVVNVTPDSFSDGGTHLDPDRAVAAGRALLEAGADIVDVGGESTRPGAEPVPADVEEERVLGVVGRLARSGAVVSIDTAKAQVAAAGLRAGAEIVNDVTAGGDPRMAQVVAGAGAGVVVMHMQGTPRTMQVDPHYDDVVEEVRDHLLGRAAAFRAAGVRPSAIVIDPGIGFGKTEAHNLTLLREIRRFVATGYPVMVGASRKAFLGRIGGVDDPVARDPATAAVTALMVAAGVAVVRVHDVTGSLQAARVAQAVARSG